MWDISEAMLHYWNLISTSFDLGFTSSKWKHWCKNQNLCLLPWKQCWILIDLKVDNYVVCPFDIIYIYWKAWHIWLVDFVIRYFYLCDISCSSYVFSFCVLKLFYLDFLRTMLFYIYHIGLKLVTYCSTKEYTFSMINMYASNVQLMHFPWSSLWRYR